MIYSNKPLGINMQIEKENIITDKGTFIKPLITAENMGHDYLSEKLIKKLQTPIKISSYEVKLNKHGGYLPVEF